MVLASVGFLLWRGVSEPDVKAPVPTPTEAPAPKNPWPDAKLTGKELKSAVVTEGTGATPKPEQLVEVSWKGWVLESKTRFADTRPTKFVLTKSTAVPGVNAALATMKAGESRLLQLPASLAYGQTGDPPAIPRDAEVMMLVTLHGISDVVEAPDKPTDAQVTDDANGVKYAILTAGTGPQVKAGDKVKIHFTIFLQDGKRLDSTHDRHAPITVSVGKGETFAGLDQSLLSMKVGEKRKVVVPPELGAGKKGRGAIPPNSTLIIEVELVSIE